MGAVAQVGLAQEHDDHPLALLLHSSPGSERIYTVGGRRRSGAREQRGLSGQGTSVSSFIERFGSSTRLPEFWNAIRAVSHRFAAPLMSGEAL